MKLSFIGAGKMATAICRGLIEKGVFKPDEIIASDPSPEARAQFSKETGVACCNKNIKSLQCSQAVVLAVKPQIAHEVLSPLCGLLENKLLISIAAGLPISQIQDWCGSNRIIRVMPNTPAMVNMGATVYACSLGVKSADKVLIKKIFESVGIVFEMTEDKLDAVTGLSGSGPAYVFEFIQALLDSAAVVGLDSKISLELVLQTISGATQMVRLKMGSPEKLRDAVTSPGGTTQTGLNVLEAGNFRQVIVNAVEKATQRSIELGNR